MSDKLTEAHGIIYEEADKKLLNEIEIEQFSSRRFNAALSQKQKEDLIEWLQGNHIQHTTVRIIEKLVPICFEAHKDAQRKRELETFMKAVEMIIQGLSYDLNKKN